MSDEQTMEERFAAGLAEVKAFKNGDLELSRSVVIQKNDLVYFIYSKTTHQETDAAGWAVLTGMIATIEKMTENGVKYVGDEGETLFSAAGWLISPEGKYYPLLKISSRGGQTLTPASEEGVVRDNVDFIYNFEGRSLNAAGRHWADEHSGWYYIYSVDYSGW